MLFYQGIPSCSANAPDSRGVPSIILNRFYMQLIILSSNSHLFDFISSLPPSLVNALMTLGALFNPGRC